MKVLKFLLVGALIGTLFGCTTTKNAGMKVNADASGTSSQVVDWSGRNLDVDAKPEWLKKLVCGNSDIFKSQFQVEKDAVVKYGIASTSARDSSIAASRVNYNAMRAEELRTKVVSEAAATLNDENFTEATANAAMLAKVDLSGHELVTQFWQEIVTTDKENDSKKKEFICYSVYKISKESWVNTLKGFLAQVIPSIPDSKAQVKMAETIQSLYDDTAKEKEITQEVALAQFKAQEEAAKARVAEAQAKTAETTAQAQVANAPQAKESDIDWMKALSTAANILF